VGSRRRVRTPYLHSRPILTNTCRLEDHRALLDLPRFSDSGIAELHAQGRAAWEQASKRYIDTGLGFLPEDGGYTRLLNLRSTFLLNEEQSRNAERPLSERLRLAQSMTLLAEMFEMVWLSWRVRASSC
jgi:hypothetical protein